MGKIVWLASYPKSGNTWMRILLANYLQDGDAPANVNALNGGPIASARVWFDEWSGVEASSLDDMVIERLRPDVYRCLARASPETLLMKAHDAWTRTDRGAALFPPDVTAGVVYLVRNPLDVAVSAAHHFGVDLDRATEILCDPDYALSRSFNGLSHQLRQYMGSWSNHVRSWLDASGLPVHPVRYEDLHANPESVFGEVVRFCGFPFDAARVRKAVAFSAFDRLQQQESTHGFQEKPLTPSPFFRRGRVGEWRADLPRPLARRLIEAHRETMRRFGYLPDDVS